MALANNKLYVRATESENLLSATLLALETGEVTPLIKEELKCTIQSRRLANGQDEMKVGPPVESTCELTEEEHHKIVRRREQNRQAARRFRIRRKDNLALVDQRVRELEVENSELRAEKANLQKMIYDHMLVCPEIASLICPTTKDNGI